MVWRAPRAGTAGTVTNALVEGVDIMPTLLDLCGVACPTGVQGRSLVPLLAGAPAAEDKESVLVQERQAPDLAARGLDPEATTMVGVRTSEWKLVHYPGQPFGELYNLRDDPGEFRNLWADAPAPRREMEHLLMERWLASQDPLPVRTHEW